MFEDIFAAADPSEKEDRKERLFRAQKQEFIEDLKSRVSDGVVKGNIDVPSKLFNFNLDGIPVKNIKKVNGFVDISNNELTSLKGMPEVVLYDFYANDNKLTSLDGAPKEVKGNVYLSKNPGPNGKGFTEDEVRAKINVRGRVTC